MSGTRPLTEKKKPTQVDNRERRSLLSKLWWVLSGIAIVEIVWMVISFLRPTPSNRSQETIGETIDAGPVEQFAPGTVTAFPQGRFYLSCLEDGGFLALSRRCTHLGCTVPWDPEKKQFVCPCHASVFNIRGEVIHAPAPRPLDRYTVTIENSRVKVKIGEPIKRASFEKKQVVYRKRGRG